ncbi:MAG: hypothetical protein KDA41_00765 [Planctomycetales bacterium]|nr:hypothetical protein [Planctomycetales bacterium]
MLGWAALVGAVGCAGYQIGTGSLYRPDVRTVHVPIFQSDSFRRQLGERLTEAVVKRIERVTPYKVVHTPYADSVLRGRVVSDRKSIITESAFDEGRDVEVNLRVEASWTDRNGNLLGGDFSQPVPAVLLSFSGSGHFLPEGGQSYATAQQDAIERLAKQIVEQMEAPW